MDIFWWISWEISVFNKQQTHTIHKVLSLTHFKKNLTLFSLKQNATCFYFFLPLLCVFFHRCREVFLLEKKKDRGLLYFIFILIRCCWSLIGRFFLSTAQHLPSIWEIWTLLNLEFFVCSMNLIVGKLFFCFKFLCKIFHEIMS